MNLFFTVLLLVLELLVTSNRLAISVRMPGPVKQAQEEIAQIEISHLQSTAESAELVWSIFESNLALHEAAQVNDLEPSISQTIEYVSPLAESVRILWGINNWQLLPEEQRPPGTTLTETGVMQTQMTLIDDHFSAILEVPADASIDFGFMVTVFDENHSKQEVWDGVYEDIQVSDQSIQVHSQVDLPDTTEQASLSNVENQGGVWIAGFGIVLAMGVLITSVAINRSRKIHGDRLHGLIPHWDLLIELVVRDIKLRYRRSVLGILWSLINPLLQLIVLSVVFGFVLPLDIEDYSLFLFIGLLGWIWFQTSVMSGTSSIVANRDLIRRPNFPINILPIVPLTSNLVHFLLSLPIVFVILLVTQKSLNLTVILLPLVIAVQFLFTLSLVYFLSVFQVFFRDTEHLIGVLLLLWFYLTPIFYNSAIVPEKYRPVFELNPMLHIINGYRDVLMYGQLPALGPLLLITGISVPAIYFGRQFLNRNYNRFVEEL